MLLDAYHIYKGGSEFTSIRLVSGTAMHVFHINDYPADPPRDKITDADRILPGDGIGPLVQLLRDMRQNGFRGALSLELFNREYWKRDALEVAKTGLEKIKAVIAKSLT
jgi:sugar phosphate isomerase/epimerase